MNNNNKNNTGSVMRKVFDANPRVIIASKQNQLHIQDSRREHLEILNSVLHGNIEQAASQLGEHILHCREAALENFYGAPPVIQSSEFTYRNYL